MAHPPAPRARHAHAARCPAVQVATPRRRAVELWGADGGLASKLRWQERQLARAACCAQLCRGVPCVMSGARRAATPAPAPTSEPLPLAPLTVGNHAGGRRAVAQSPICSTIVARLVEGGERGLVRLQAGGRWRGRQRGWSASDTCSTCPSRCIASSLAPAPSHLDVAALREGAEDASQCIFWELFRWHHPRAAIPGVASELTSDPASAGE